MNWKYKAGDVITNKNGRKGVIQSRGTSIIDGKTIPSYWVVYGLSVHPDGYARNTWESSIMNR